MRLQSFNVIQTFLYPVQAQRAYPDTVRFQDVISVSLYFEEILSDISEELLLHLPDTGLPVGDIRVEVFRILEVSLPVQVHELPSVRPAQLVYPDQHSFSSNPRYLYCLR